MSTTTMFRLEGRIDGDAFFSLYDLFSGYGDMPENKTAALLLNLAIDVDEQTLEQYRSAGSLQLFGDVSEYDLRYLQMVVEENLDCCTDQDVCSALDRALDQLARMTQGASLRLA